MTEGITSVASHDRAAVRTGMTALAMFWMTGTTVPEMNPNLPNNLPGVYEMRRAACIGFLRSLSTSTTAPPYVGVKQTAFPYAVRIEVRIALR